MLKARLTHLMVASQTSSGGRLRRFPQTGYLSASTSPLLEGVWFGEMAAASVSAVALLAKAQSQALIC